MLFFSSNQGVIHRAAGFPEWKPSFARKYVHTKKKSKKMPPICLDIETSKGKIDPNLIKKTSLTKIFVCSVGDFFYGFTTNGIQIAI